MSFSSSATLMRVDIDFEASDFFQHNPFGGAAISPPINFVYGSLSFLIQDPTPHASFFIVDDVSPINFELNLGGVDFSANDVFLQYRLFRNQFWSFSAGADIDGPGLDVRNSISQGTTDFWITTTNNSSSFFYSLNGVVASFNSDNLITRTTVTPVSEPTIGLMILIFGMYLLRRNIQN